MTDISTSSKLSMFGKLYLIQLVVVDQVRPVTMNECATSPTQCQHGSGQDPTRALTEQGHQTSCKRSPGHIPPCTARSSVGAIAASPLLPNDLPHFARDRMFRTSQITMIDESAKGTDLMYATVNRNMSVQIMPRMNFRFPSMMSETLLETEL